MHGVDNLAPGPSLRVVDARFVRPAGGLVDDLDLGALGPEFEDVGPVFARGIRKVLGIGVSALRGAIVETSPEGVHFFRIRSTRVFDLRVHTTRFFSRLSIYVDLQNSTRRVWSFLVLG